MTQRRVVIPYRRFGTTVPEMSVRNYHSTPRNILEERRSQLHRGGSLKSRKVLLLDPEADGRDHPSVGSNSRNDGVASRKTGNFWLKIYYLENNFSFIEL
jgi:hypothetical protein